MFEPATQGKVGRVKATTTRVNWCGIVESGRGDVHLAGLMVKPVGRVGLPLSLGCEEV